MAKLNSGAAFPSFITFYGPTRTFTVSTTNSAHIGVYETKLTGIAPNGQTIDVIFKISVTHCASTTITASTFADTQYSVTAPSTIFTFTAFTFTSLCAHSYTLTKSDGTAIDSALFTFDATNLKLTVYTTDNTKVGTKAL